MTGFWNIITPEAGTNHAPNPSFERDTGDWANVAAGSSSGTRTRQAASALQGFWGVELDKTSAVGTGAFGLSTTAYDQTVFASGDYVTASIFVNVPSGSAIDLDLDVTAGSTYQDNITQVGPYTGRIEITVGPLGAASTAVAVQVAIPTGYNGTVDIDGLQIEGRNGSTTYFDGDTPGCYWDGAYYASSSTRPASVRSSGVIENFDDYGLYITGMNDIGMADVKHNIDSYALQDGALYRNSYVPQRVFSLTGEIIGTSFADLHDKRRALINLFKPDVTGKPEPFWLVYTGSGESLQIEARYNGGLEFGNRNGFSERVSLRLIAMNPYFQKAYNQGADISAIYSFSGNLNLAGRIQGQWSGISDSGVEIDNGFVYALAYHEGKIYVGGSFTSVNSDGDMSYIAMLDDTGWSALGTGANGDVNALVVTPDGDLYAGGAFTSMGGVANTNRIARWDGTAWNALGTGGNGDVEALAYSHTEKVVYMGGAFTTMNGVANARMARWDVVNGSFDSAPGAADNNSVFAIAIAPNGDVYYGGSFTAAGSGVSGTSRLARYDGTSVYALSTGANNTVYALAADENGHVFVGGVFTTAGGVTVAKVAEWNGYTFTALAEGISGTVYALHFLLDGTLAIGSSSSGPSGGVQPTGNGLAYWNGTTLFLPDFNINAGDIVYAIESGGKYDIIAAGDFAACFFGTITTISNGGTRKSSPRIQVRCTSLATRWVDIYRIELYEANGLIAFGPLWLSTLETIEIDTRPGHIGILSNFKGTRLDEVSRVSSFTSMVLLPGDNSFLITGIESDSTYYEVSVIWNDYFWSADGF